MSVKLRLLIGLILSLTLVSGGCGGKSPSGTKSKGARDGRIYVRNMHESTITVRYFNEEKGTIIETDVETGKTEEVSKAVIAGGMEVTLTVKGLVNRLISSNQTTAQDIKVRIDGDVTITVTNITSGGVDYSVQ